MTTNVFFNHAVQTEHNLYEDLIVESLRMYGHETFYLPREVMEEDVILGEDVQSTFGDSYSVEMYIENSEGFEGDGDLMSKFGVQVRDTATFVLSLRSWERFISLDSNLATSLRPNEVGKLFVFKLQCELFEYSGEDFDTDIGNIDVIENKQAYVIDLTMNSGSGAYVINENVTLSGVVVGEVSNWAGASERLNIVHNTKTLQVGDTLVGAESGTSRTIASITDIMTMSNDGNAQNLDFETKGDAYLDFSETNPFGEVT
mgnify:CR=1 FL=1